MIKIGIEEFQDRLNLTVTGNLTEETLKWMTMPRCGVPDTPQAFAVGQNEGFTHKNISWYYYGKDYAHFRTVEAAFNLWSKHANINFYRTLHSPDISITVCNTKHWDVSDNTECGSDFDGRGGILGHAYSASKDRPRTDVHLDSSEPWEYGMVTPLPGHTSFFMVLAHEIGHTLGIKHSTQSDSIMHYMYHFPQHITSIYDIDLAVDDILAVQSIYGKRPTPPPPPPPTPQPTPPTPSQPVAPQEPKPSHDVCEYKNKINTVAIADGNIHLFYKQFVWIISLDETKRESDQFTKPYLMEDWLNPPPHNFTEVLSVYERHNSEIGIVPNNKELNIYDYPAYTMKSRLLLEHITHSKQVVNVNGLFNSAKGISYLVVNNGLVHKFDDCSPTGSFVGKMDKVFPEVPANFVGAFRHNGKMYFKAKTGIVFEFDEFLNRVTNTYPSVFDALALSCPTDDILKQLHDLVSRLVHLRTDTG